MPETSNQKLLIEENLETVLLNLRSLETKYQRPLNSVKLLAVSKTKPIEDIITANMAGQKSFGESYVQEAIEKIALNHSGLDWHFIGPIQKNKTRLVAENFQWVHSVDRLIIAKRLNDQRPKTLTPLHICIQVNIDNETSKAGVTLDEVEDLTTELSGFDNIKLRGLMAIPRASNDVNEQRNSFAKLRNKLEHLNQLGFKLDTLSMGMSNDLEAAIAEGATIVRVGTAIFGKRATKT
ncbi:MAG: YggS family pyridoxal phosphate-dependent enzyme [Gammaproteobacteria bacterium]